MSPDLVNRQIELATFFVRRVLGLPAQVRGAIAIPSYQDEYYVQATLQVRLLLQRAGAKTFPEFVARAEQAIEKSGLPGELASIAGEAVRAILIWPLAEAQPWAASVYEPFESIIPYGWAPR